MAHSEDNSGNNFMQNRELSWLKFNKRVLEEAQDEIVPLYERLKFISIFTSNLDEFFMVRVGSLTDLSLMGNNNIDNKTGMTPKQQLTRVFENTIPLYQLKDKIFNDVETELREFGVYNLNLSEMGKSEKRYIEQYYQSDILPILSPQIIDSRHPFPHLINKGLYIICEFHGQDKKFGLIPISQSLPRFILLPGNQTRYILTEKIVLDHTTDIFGMYVVECAAIISVTRNADISPEDEIFEVDDDYREQMKKVLKKRGRLSPVRMEVQGHLSKTLTNFLLDKLHISKEQVFACVSPIVMNYVFELSSKLPVVLLKQLSYPAFKPIYPVFLNHNENITSQCRRKDILLFYPYHQMEPFLHLLKESSQDPNVISIKITIYRLSRNSRIIDYLITAAENNKEVTVLVELKARFDEENNIEWAERLEEAGCNVIYGFEGFKVHSKICLITRRDRNKIVYITQVGTGNYNEKTAKLYTDLSLITSNKDIGQDASEFFKNMSISNLKGQYNNLFVAPYSFKNNMLALMDNEIEKAKRGESALIIIKSNSLTDKDIIMKLSEASQTGVKVKLIIRGICCLLPGVKGKTENIMVTSVVGRFLEHSRIYCFGTDKDMKVYISSADMMTRNTSKRVEIACPILDAEIKNQILHIFDIIFKDNVKARLLGSDGIYRKKETAGGLTEDFFKDTTEDTAKEITGNINDILIQDIPDYISQDIYQDMSEDVPQDISEDTSSEILENSFDSQQYMIEEFIFQSNQNMKSNIWFQKLVKVFARHAQ
ncbi:polyphosphate kinase 1 [Anaerocolumna sp. MB42-C2]|uniref:polyphosphate kinase 1 n=1 Tax=Anaerocolumna sp. MB42-C2 TaxID=3070997 RepID=UPI0027E0DEFD|nr:polyphosphate kinase 1 [Anaerocolumna sp. MB42-C2]WMJ87295.1 polyphosphate kinase 1 [Anaerocolumna sp. MB42-C2]